MTDHQRGMNEIVGACISQFHDDADSFELLLAFADGRESGYLVSRRSAQRIAAEFANEFGEPSNPVAEAVKVKPLEWHTTEDVTQNTTGVCAYKIEHWEGGGFGVYLHGYVGLHNGRCETLDEAKAAAQADYEQRIMSALSTPTQPEALQRRVEELEAALKPFADRANRYNEVPGIIQFDDSCELWQLEKNKGMEVDITVGDLRRARAALIPQEQKKDG